LAFTPLRVDGSGLAWSAPLSLLAVFAMVWHEPWAEGVVLGCAGLFAVLWMVRAKGRGPRAALVMALGLLGCWLLTSYGQLPGGESLPWPWYTPVGTLVAVAFGWALDRQREVLPAA
jgi:peptidoglycan/LPS O-acetylase OafA/YrhL